MTINATDIATVAHDDNATPQAIAEAAWRMGQELDQAENGDITALGLAIAKEADRKGEGYEIRDRICEALEEISAWSSGRHGHDARGRCEILGDEVAWWNNGASSEWCLLSECGRDELADLGM